MAVAFDAMLARVKDVCKRNGLLILSVLSVIVGCLLGFFLRTRRLSQQEISYFQFPGELLMRMLKMLILPLVVSSLMSGLAALDAKTSSRLGIITVTYYLWTTFVAVIVGIIMVSIIHPGGAAQKENTEENGKPIMSSADALLDLIRNMFPANLVEATFKQYRTKSIPIVKSNKAASESTTRRIIIYGVQDENGSNVQNFALDITPPPEVIYKSEPGTSDGMNVLGIVIFSATMGIMLGRMGNSGVPLVSFCQCLNESVMKIVAVSVWYFPFGIVFLIAGKILEMDDPTAIGKKLGFYAITVVCGLVVHGLFILPMMYFFITKKNPIVFIRGILQALLIALATSSSITATAASIGAAGIPQAGLVTMVIVLTSVGLPTDDITLIIAVDWALDRFRTMINVLGDALAAGIMAHVCRKEFTKDGDEVPLICETKPISIHQIMAYQRNGCVKNMSESHGPETVKVFQHHIPIQVEQELNPAGNHTKKSNSKDHCTIEINELETNV
ncbi:excitatory amino acid transporter 5 isoform X4 [Dermochelys coriacea]|uniref:excitatory amino acid transporter 5 isoform X4 n=1 Tax=Dermochelys coriacea TaxID=27794 RepID=UPI001CA8D032|nr:excitatory amino acid transporter 5 isoform X4 [Dermochelys coriacea]